MFAYLYQFTFVDPIINYLIRWKFIQTCRLLLFLNPHLLSHFCSISDLVSPLGSWVATCGSGHTFMVRQTDTTQSGKMRVIMQWCEYTACLVLWWMQRSQTDEKSEYVCNIDQSGWDRQWSSLPSNTGGFDLSTISLSLLLAVLAGFLFRIVSVSTIVPTHRCYVVGEVIHLQTRTQLTTCTHQRIVKLFHLPLYIYVSE